MARRPTFVCASWLVLLLWAPGTQAQKTPIKPTKNQKLLQEHRQLLGEAEKLFQSWKHFKGVATLEKVLVLEKELYGEGNEQVVSRLKQLGMYYEHLGQFLLARKKLEAVLKIQTQKHGNKDWRTEDAHRALEDLALRQKMKLTQRKQLVEAVLLNREVVRLYRAGRFREAVQIAGQALEIHKAVLGEKHQETAISLSWLAEVYRAQGDYEKTLPLYQQALKITKAILGDKHPTTARSLNNLAMLCQDQGDFAKALLLFQEALIITRTVLGEDHADTATNLNNLAALYQAQGDYAKALPLFQQALKITKAVLGENHTDTARSLNNLAGLYKDQGDYKKALPLLQQALKIHQTLLDDKHPLTALSLNNLAALYQDQGNFEKAMPLYDQALRIRKVVLGDNHPDTAGSLNNLANLCQIQGKYGKALPLYHQALKIHKAVLDEKHPSTATSLYNLATLYRDQGDYVRAEKWYRQAARAFQASRDLVSLEGLKRASFTSEHSPLLSLSSVLAHNEKSLEAWEYLEKSLGRSTWDEIKIRQRLSETEQKELQRLQGGIQSRQKLLQNLASTPKLSDDQQALQKRYFTEQGELYAKLGEFHEKAQKKYGVLGGSSSTLKQIQKQMPTDMALLTWVDVNRGEHWVVVVRAKGDPVFTRISGSGPGGVWAKDDNNLADNLCKRLFRPTLNWREELEALRKQRIDPVLKHLKDIDHLIILPSLVMDGIPVELLVKNKGVSYAPSGTVLTYLKGLKKPQGKGLLALGDPLFKDKAEAAKLPEHGLLLTTVVPNSSAAKAGLQVDDVLQSYHKTTIKTLDDLRKASSQPGLPKTVAHQILRKGNIRETDIAPGSMGVAIAREPAPVILARRQQDRELMHKLRGGDWTDSPGTRVEVDALKARFKDATIYTDSQASEQTLQKLVKSGNLSKYRYLHFATHGEMNRINRMQSAIILSHDQLPDTPTAVKMLEEGKAVPDGRLTAKEVLEKWKLDADLVTISACESGLGQHQRGEGFMGFSQAFLLTGARSVVLSLWKVDDTATALLMDRFYENLLGQREGIKPMTKVLALKEAKEWLRTLPRAEVLTRAAKISKGVVRGKGNPDLPLLKEVPKVAKEEKDVPYAHPYYWAAFILIGDPK